MKHRRMAWTACVVLVSGLGISGLLAGGCGGDDTAPAGTAGAGGSAGSTTTAAGGNNAGTAGTGGGSTGGGGTATTKDSGSDAPVACMPAKMTPTAMKKLFARLA